MSIICCFPSLCYSSGVVFQDVFFHVFPEAWDEDVWFFRSRKNRIFRRQELRFQVSSKQGHLSCTKYQERSRKGIEHIQERLFEVMWNNIFQLGHLPLLNLGTWSARVRWQLRLFAFTHLMVLKLNLKFAKCTTSNLSKLTLPMNFVKIWTGRVHQESMWSNLG